MIKKVLKKIKESKVASNSFWMVVTTIIQMIVSLVINRIVAGYLGVTNYGIINYGISFINFFLGFCTLGLRTITIKYLVNEKDNQGTIIGTVLLMRIISSAISIIMIFLCILLLKGDDKTIIAVTMLQSLALLFESFTTIGWFYQYKLQSKYTAFITFIGYIVSAIYKIILVLLKKGVIWFAISNCISYIMIAILLFLIYKKQGNPNFKVSFIKGKEMLGQSYHFILSSLMVAIYAQTDKIMIGSIVNSMSAVGLYSVCTTITQLWNFLPSAIIESFKPAILEEKVKSEKLYKNKLIKLYSIIIWLSIIYTLFIIVFGKTVINILYGAEYLDALNCLKIAIFGVSFSFIGVIREFWLICEKRQKYAKWFSLFGVICNIGLNYLLIPKMGIIGAAIATAVTQFASGIIASIVFKETREANIFVLKGLTFNYRGNNEK